MARRSMAWYQMDLATFLVVCLLAGVTTSFYARALWRPTAHTSRWDIDGFLIDMKWKGWNEREKFSYLVAYPDRKMRVTTNTEGIIINGRNRTAERPNSQFWIAVATSTGYDVRSIDAACLPEALKDYEAFKKTEFWTKHLRPTLIEESKRYDRWWFEKHGTKNRDSRFTSDETWSQWKQDRESIAEQ